MVLLAAMFVATLDNFIVFIAIPSLQANLQANFAQIEFIVAGYTLAFAMGLITSGRLGDRFGRRRMFGIGFGAFTLASSLCGLAPSADTLIVFRVLQGISAALLTPQALALIRVTFVSDSERAIAFGWLGVVMGCAAITGQVLGGFIVSADLWGLSWRPIFLVNVPVGLLALLAMGAVLQESRVPSTQRLDLMGAVLSTAGLGLLLFPLVEGREAGWPDSAFVILACSVVILAVFAFHQHRKTKMGRAPLLDTNLVSDRAFALGVGIVLLFYIGLGPFLLSLTYLFQAGYGHDPVRAALDFVPMAVTFACTSFAAGRPTRINQRSMLTAGAGLLALSAVAVVVLFRIFPEVTTLELIPLVIVLGLGQGLFMTPVMNVVLSSVEDHHVGATAGVLATVQNAGIAFGVAMLGIPFFGTAKRVLAEGGTTLAAYQGGFSSVMTWVGALMISVVILLRYLPRRKVEKDGAPVSVRAVDGGPQDRGGGADGQFPSERP